MLLTEALSRPGQVKRGGVCVDVLLTEALSRPDRLSVVVFV